MKNILQIQRSKSFIFKSILLLALLGVLPLTGSDCDNAIIGNGISGDIVGTWQLTGITGYLQDVCEGEVVTYDSTGIATLQCPNSNPITRIYTISNNVLTYTETGVQYDITTLSNTTLILEGKNIGRNLSYTRLPADHVTGNTESTSQSGKNSSE